MTTVNANEPPYTLVETVEFGHTLTIDGTNGTGGFRRFMDRTEVETGACSGVSLSFGPYLRPFEIEVWAVTGSITVTKAACNTAVSLDGHTHA